ncbi:hypothetical protein BYT27DRAFT_7090879 [Phlegmacium glaucopus]|nr:hypothetical protein BYT27DRAFT_7090879 [Phlegmacium glaucopus]
MDQVRSRSSSPRTERSSAPWFTTRVVSLLLAWCWGIIGAAVGLNALVKSNEQKAAVNRAVPRPTIVTINIRDVYVLGVLSTTACLLIVAFTTTFLCMTLCRPKSFHRTLFFQAMLLILSCVWLFSVLVPLTIFHAKRSARVNAYLDGIQLPVYVVNTVENALDITGVYKRIYYLRIAVVLPWFTFLFTLFAAVMLFIASYSVEHLDQAYEENHAPTGIRTRTVPTVNRDTKERIGQRRSPMAVSEKSAGPGSAIGSPDTHRSRSVTDHSPRTN